MFLAHDPERLEHILAQAKASLRDAAAVNSTRWALYERLVALRLPVEVGSGGRTKYNRSRQKMPKIHWTDAACVGASTPEVLQHWQTVRPLLITATGRQCRQMVNMDTHGFPRGRPKGPSRSHGFRTGVVEGIHARYCRPLYRGDGYGYALGSLAALPPPV